MRNILVLVDFTEAARIAVKQAIELAKPTQAVITLFHVAQSGGGQADSSGDQSSIGAEFTDGLQNYREQIAAAGLQDNMVVASGDLYKEAAVATNTVDPDLVIVATHGKKGLRQNLFGSNIYKLVQSLKVPSLVVNENTMVKNGRFKKAFLPVAPHADFLMKVEQTLPLLDPEGQVVLFAILKPGVPLDEHIQRNVEETTRFLHGKEVPYEYLELDSSKFSVGFAKETLNYLQEHDADMVSIMARVSDQNQNFGKLDKENMLFNEKGLPVLCASS